MMLAYAVEFDSYEELMAELGEEKSVKAGLHDLANEITLFRPIITWWGKLKSKEKKSIHRKRKKKRKELVRSNMGSSAIAYVIRIQKALQPPGAADEGKAESKLEFPDVVFESPATMTVSCKFYRGDVSEPCGRWIPKTFKPTDIEAFVWSMPYNTGLHPNDTFLITRTQLQRAMGNFAALTTCNVWKVLLFHAYEQEAMVVEVMQGIAGLLGEVEHLVSVTCFCFILIIVKLCYFFLLSDRIGSSRRGRMCSSLVLVARRSWRSWQFTLEATFLIIDPRTPFIGRRMTSVIRN